MPTGPTTPALATAPVPEVRVDYVLDAVTLAHAGIVLSLVASVGFGVAAECDSAWLGLAAAVAVAVGWLGVCKVRAVRNRLVRVMRWLAE